MMIAHIETLTCEERVTDVVEAAKRGAMERLSPIFMTALNMIVVPALYLRFGSAAKQDEHVHG